MTTARRLKALMLQLDVAEDVITKLVKYYEGHKCSDCDCPIYLARDYLQDKQERENPS